MSRRQSMMVSGGSGSAASLTQVATRTVMPLDKSVAANPVMVRSFHYARDDISAVKVVFPNCYGPLQTLSGGTLTTSASIEYPANTFTQLTFSGSPTGVTSGALLTSDLVTLSVPIPNGAKFFVRNFSHWSAGIMTCEIGNYMSAAGGDIIDFDGHDQTMGGTITQEGVGLGIYPAAIVGVSSKRAIAIMGDSRSAGVLDVVGASGDVGEVARPLGSTYAYMNWSCSGGAAFQYVAPATAALVELSQYVNTVIINLGINDLQGLVLPAAVLTSLLTLRAQFASKQVFAATITPRTYPGTTWTAADGSDQVAQEPIAAYRITLNSSIRASAAFTGFLEIATQLELGADAKKWKADGVADHYTGDGLHANAFGNAAIALTLPAYP